jgi:N-acetylglucosamine-6-phosphate deacetylase
MIFLSGADIVLPDRVIGEGTVVIDGNRIGDITAGPRSAGSRDVHLDLHRHYLVPGFIDVHVHGVEGIDALDGEAAIAEIAARLPRHGVTAFCPTSLACRPSALREMLASVRRARALPVGASARVLPAHLESNFINPEFKGAQPIECLRTPSGGDVKEGEFTGQEILAEISASRAEVGIVTLAPELGGAIELIRDLVAHGHHVSLGHSGASYDEALAGIAAGARQATHLFNRMTPMAHRAPGLTGAVLEQEAVTAELVCDGVHVHPSIMRVALAAKRPSGIMAITDGTAGSGLRRGDRTLIGGREIVVRDVAYLADGTIAGSVLTMDRAFSLLVTSVGLGVVDAVTICSTTPARALGLRDLGTIAVGALADLVVLDRQLNVVHTFIDGSQVAGVSL